jgi:hypothetical protein
MAIEKDEAWKMGERSRSGENIVIRQQGFVTVIE